MRAALALLVISCATVPVAPTRSAVPDDVRALRLLASSGSTASTQPCALRQQVFGPAKGDVREVYRKVAPATVLVRTPTGFGTGAVIDARGYVLTNHHVVASAENVDFKRRVQVERGKLGPTGAMELDGKPLTGWVLKSDPLMDLAIIKLDAPPADLKALTISKTDPSPGEPVSAIGNGSIGLLWAIKDGEISSIGKLATHLAQLAGSECRVSAGEDATAAESCRATLRTVELERERLEQQVPALVIQTSCTISPGDSGGPLVNRAGQLVGVNAFLRSDSHAPVTTNFHIHVAEVRSFLKEVPTEPVAIVPSPFSSLGAGAWADADGDGTVDLFVAQRLDGASVLVELRGQRASTLEADLAIVRQGNLLTAWYDVDGDGVLDRVVMGDRSGAGRAWSLRKETQLGAFLGAAKSLDPSTFPDARRTRLEAMLPAIGLALGLGTASSIEDVPALNSPVLGEPRALDLDRDGVLDAISGSTLEGTRVVLDPSQAIQKSALKQAFTKGGPLTVLVRGGQRWVVASGVEASVIFGLGAGGDFITHAWTLTPTGSGDRRPEYFGRDVGSAVSEIVQGGQTADASRALVALHTECAELATRYGAAHPRMLECREKLARQTLDPVRTRALAQLAALLGTPVRKVSARLPDFGPELTDAVVERVDVPGLELAVVSRTGSANALLLSLDPRALEGSNTQQREADARAGHADFAWFERDGFSWTAADLDRDGIFDVVTAQAGTQTVRWVNGVRQDNVHLVDPSIFPDDRAKALEKLAPLFFNAGPR
jgi:S1-C subfamily serine protease